MKNLGFLFALSLMVMMSCKSDTTSTASTDSATVPASTSVPVTPVDPDRIALSVVLPDGPCCTAWALISVPFYFDRLVVYKGSCSLLKESFYDP